MEQVAQQVISQEVTMFIMAAVRAPVLYVNSEDWEKGITETKYKISKINHIADKERHCFRKNPKLIKLYHKLGRVIRPANFGKIYMIKFQGSMMKNIISSSKIYNMAKHQ